MSAYLNLFGVAPSEINRLSRVAVNGGVASPGSGEAEVLLDIDTVITGAPRASVVVYDAPGTTSFQSLFNAMLNDGDTVISNSWSYCEDQTSLADAQSIDAIFAKASASGVSIFNASGDHGSSCLDGSAEHRRRPRRCPPRHRRRRHDRHARPGLRPTAGRHGGTGATPRPPTGQGGFGVSRFFPRPAYQDGLTTAAMRSVPDVVADADPASGIAALPGGRGRLPGRFTPRRHEHGGAALGGDGALN